MATDISNHLRKKPLMDSIFHTQFDCISPAKIKQNKQKKLSVNQTISSYNRSMYLIFIQLTSFLVGTKSLVTHQVVITINGTPKIKIFINK